jgi:hypothetical protein
MKNVPLNRYGQRMNPDYLNSEVEGSSRVMQAKHQYNIEPKVLYTKNDIKNMRESGILNRYRLNL